MKKGITSSTLIYFLLAIGTILTVAMIIRAAGGDSSNSLSDLLNFLRS